MTATTSGRRGAPAGRGLREACARTRFMIRGGTLSCFLSPSCGAAVPSRRSRMKKWLSVGVQLSASASDVSSAMPTVTASARKNVPVTPVIATSGRNTTIGVIVEPTSGALISWMALRIASPRDCPLSRCITMFSTTTIASSMTRPTAAARPPSVIRLKLSPSSRRTMNVTASVAGITSPATSEVPQSRRNSTMMSDASTSPRITASRTLLIESPTMSDWS